MFSISIGLNEATSQSFRLIRVSLQSIEQSAMLVGLDFLQIAASSVGGSSTAELCICWVDFDRQVTCIHHRKISVPLRSLSRWSTTLELAPNGCSKPVPLQRLSLYWNANNNVEDISYYTSGGYHAIRLGEVLSTPADAEPSNSCKYRILNKLGHGAFSTVWQ